MDATINPSNAQDLNNISTLSNELKLLKQKQDAEFNLTPAGQEIQLIKAKQDADFSLTPVGQELQRFMTNQRMGQMYASSTLVPDTYKGNVANCAIAIDMATRMNANALMVMQNLYLVHGNPSWSSKFLIATINTCGRFQPLRYECNNKRGDDYGWRCFTYAIDDKDKQERLEGPWVTWSMVKNEGWNKKNGSKWLSMPEQMFRYRAAAFWQRLYAPEISMGFNTVEESQDIAEDVSYVEVDADGKELQSIVPKHTTVKQRIADMARERARANAGQREEAVPDPVEEVKKTEPMVDMETGEIKEMTDVDLGAMSDEEYDALMNSFEEESKK